MCKNNNRSFQFEGILQLPAENVSIVDLMPVIFSFTAPIKTLKAECCNWRPYKGPQYAVLCLQCMPNVHVVLNLANQRTHQYTKVGLTAGKSEQANLEIAFEIV